MKIIFLDVDGVLNCQRSKASCGGIMGIDDAFVKRLKEIVDAAGAKIVLTSSWRMGWEKFNKECQDAMADYLDRKLKRQRLYILDKIDNCYTYNRGEGIIKWLEGKRVESYVILDDEMFDYEKLSIARKVVKTEFYSDKGGLQPESVLLAIKMLN